MPIYFTNETSFRIRKLRKLKDLLSQILSDSKLDQGEIAYVITTDEKILSINQEFLQHDFYTDIITFPMSEKGEPISADIIISIDTVKSNALLNSTKLQDEFKRVCIHGILHLCGYNDKKSKEKQLMRDKEAFYLDNSHLT